MGLHELVVPDSFVSMLDSGLGGLRCFSGAEERSYSPFLPRGFVLAKNYVNSFPQHAFLVENGVHAEERYLLSPTCCYPVFHALSGSRVSNGLMVTHKGYCFRCEEYYKTGVRQISYLMREYILLCEDLEVVTEWIEGVKRDVFAFISGLGLRVSVVKATDPFFNVDDYKEKFQRDQGLKHEFVINDVAVASVNLHLKAFSKSCEITSGDGKSLYSACFGLGYDRLYHQVFLAKRDAAVFEG